MKTAVPLVLALQPEASRPLTVPKRLAAWETAVRDRAGIEADDFNMTVVSGETCSGGCTDDCSE